MEAIQKYQVMFVAPTINLLLSATNFTRFRSWAITIGYLSALYDQHPTDSYLDACSSSSSSTSARLAWDCEPNKLGVSLTDSHSTIRLSSSLSARANDLITYKTAVTTQSCTFDILLMQIFAQISYENGMIILYSSCLVKRPRNAFNWNTQPQVMLVLKLSGSNVQVQR